MNFMRGRRGLDQFGLFLIIASLVVEILGRILKVGVIYYIGVMIFIYCMARAMSRNWERREEENRRYLNIRNRIENQRYFRQQKKNGRYERADSERKRNGRHSKTVYAYYYCPSCRQQVRIPAGKGKVVVTCPKCGRKFNASS